MNVGSALKNGERGGKQARGNEKEGGGKREMKRRRTAEGGRESDKFLSVIMDTSKASRVFNEDHPPTASHRR